MADQTIVSGATITLAVPLTGGTNVDFLNVPTASGTLVIDPAALIIHHRDHCRHSGDFRRDPGRQYPEFRAGRT